MDVNTSPFRLRVVVIVAWTVAAGVGCALRSGYIGTTAASFLNTARTSPDPNMRYLAYQKLASDRCYDDDEQKAQAARFLAEKLAAGQEPLAARAAICRTLGELRRPEGHDALLATLNSEEAILRAEAARALGKLGTPDDAAHLGRIMAADLAAECRVAAIEGLGLLKTSDPNVHLMLVEAMENDDPAIRVAALRSLKELTGKDLGVEVAPWRAEVERRLPLAAGAASGTVAR